MPIVITPSGEYVDSVTGNPVNTTLNRVSELEGDMARFISKDPSQRSMSDSEMDMRQRTGATPTVEELQSDLGGAMARENIPANLDMGMDSEMAAADLSDVDKVRMLIDMGLNPQEAMEVIAREKTGSAIAPQEFGRVVDSGMGALSGVPAGGQAPMPMPTPRPEDLMERQMPMGRDRTFNPRDAINPFNAPST